MKEAVERWIDAQKKKLRKEPVTSEDLDALMNCLQEPRQHVLYLYSKSTNMRSPIASWSHCDPTKPQEPTLPSQELPYASVLEAMADGWRRPHLPRCHWRMYRHRTLAVRCQQFARSLRLSQTVSQQSVPLSFPRWPLSPVAPRPFSQWLNEFFQPLRPGRQTGHLPLWWGSNF